MKKIIFAAFLISLISNYVSAEWHQGFASPMPEAVSNQAVCLAFANDTPFVYSFGGIDSTKLFSGIHLRSYKYNVFSNQWQNIDPLPDTLGKIATAASCVKNKIYIMGGYHVFANGSEITSNKVHVFDPESNQFLQDASPIPVAVDDHVQSVWRDSLIYLITGWSNTTNVPNVQIFNPSNNTWQVGTSVPNNNIYKSFGASGTIVGDTIFYYGGASLGFNFPVQNQLRIGIINPANPTDISWQNPSTHLPNYRSVAVAGADKRIYFLGGAPKTYNFDGIAFDGSGGINPNANSSYIAYNDWTNWQDLPLDLPMDLRGVAQLSPHQIYIAGGIKNNQKVSNELIYLAQVLPTGIKENSAVHRFNLYPNPSQNQLIIENKLKDNKTFQMSVWDTQGKLIFEDVITENKYPLAVQSWTTGSYRIYLKNEDSNFSFTFVKP